MSLRETIESRQMERRSQAEYRDMVVIVRDRVKALIDGGATLLQPSPAAAGRFSDRAGRMAPIRAGLTAAIVVAILLPLPDTAVLVGVAVALAAVALGTFWAPGMALLSDAAEDAGLDQALAFAISNLAWALGHVFGAGVGGAAADATSDAVPYAALAVACGLTLAGLTANRRRSEALST